jgi:hypothetical protein
VEPAIPTWHWAGESILFLGGHIVSVISATGLLSWKHLTLGNNGRLNLSNDMVIFTKSFSLVFWQLLKIVTRKGDENEKMAQD